jgi:hypothetical protein
LREIKGRRGVVTVTDLVEDWIEMRSKLQRQLKMLEAGEMRAGDKAFGSSTTATIERLNKCISELNDLLKEHASGIGPKR